MPLPFSLNKESIGLGVLVVTGTLWIVNNINGLAQTEDAKIGLMDHRVTVLEDHDKGSSQSIDRLSGAIDQLSARMTLYNDKMTDNLNSLAAIVAKVQQVVDDTRKR